MGEAVLEEDEDWIPDNEVMSPISDDLEDIRSVRGVSRLPIVKVISTDHLSSVFNQPAVNTHNTRCQTSYLDAWIDDKNDADCLKEPSNLPEASDSVVISHLKKILTQKNQRVEALEHEVKMARGILQKLVGKREDGVQSEEIGGGRISVSDCVGQRIVTFLGIRVFWVLKNVCVCNIKCWVCFHVATLLGKGSETVLPRTATMEEQESWLNDQPLELVSFNMNLDLSTGEQPPNSSCSENKGPSHCNTTPQQLSVMRQMMKTVGVARFWPDFS